MKKYETNNLGIAVLHALPLECCGVNKISDFLYNKADELNSVIGLKISPSMFVVLDKENRFVLETYNKKIDVSYFKNVDELKEVIPKYFTIMIGCYYTKKHLVNRISKNPIIMEFDGEAHISRDTIPYKKRDELVDISQKLINAYDYMALSRKRFPIPDHIKEYPKRFKESECFDQVILDTLMYTTNRFGYDLSRRFIPNYKKGLFYRDSVDKKLRKVVWLLEKRIKKEKKSDLFLKTKQEIENILKEIDGFKNELVRARKSLRI